MKLNLVSLEWITISNVIEGCFTTNWIPTLASTNISHRGLGTLTKANFKPVRLLDSGGIAVGTFDVNALLSGLVSYWKLDEVTGNAEDSFGLNTLTNYQLVTFSTGLMNNGANFGNDGTFRKLARAGNLGLSVDGARSFSCWIKMNSEITIGESWFLANRNVTSSISNNEFELAYDYNAGNRRVYFQKTDNNTHIASNRINYPIALGISTWHHLVGTTDGTNLNFYVDGSLKGTVSDFVSNGNNSFGASTFELGQTDRPTNFKMDEFGVWSRALSAAEVTSLFDSGNGLIFLPTSLNLPEPTVFQPKNWRGNSIASGSLRATNGQSIFYTFTEDKNTNGVLDLGDDFVVAEYLVNANYGSLITVSRRPISTISSAQSYGLASVNFLNSSNEVFFTGEPDGQVFAWTVTGTSNPLQRQLFSADHAGKAWHAFSSLKTIVPGEGLIGLRVDPVAPKTCNVIFWSPTSQLPQFPSLPNTSPAAAVMPSTNSLGSLALLTVRLWDAEGNSSTPFLQYQISGSTNWQSATLMNLDGGPYSSSNRVAASPGGINHTIVWNAQLDLGGNILTNVLLRARARDMALLGDWSVGTPFQVNMNQDSNTNGIPDWWELQYIGSLQPANGDYDGDGFNNFSEYIADTNPADPNSNLRIMSLTPVAGGVQIFWQGGNLSTQYLQERLNFDISNSWTDIFTNPPPTPNPNFFTSPPSTNGSQFYRVRVTR